MKYTFAEMGNSTEPKLWIPDSEPRKKYLSFVEMAEYHPEVCGPGLPYSVVNG